MKKQLTFCLALLALLCNSAHAQLPSYLPTDGLVGWWPFNGNANDESGNGNDGVVNGAVLTEDRFGNPASAYNFSTTSANILTPLEGPTGQSSRSFAFWFYTDSLNDNFPDYRVMLRYGGDQEFTVFAIALSQAGLTVDAGATYIAYDADYVGNHHHLVVTYDVADGITIGASKVYLDGVLLTNVTATTAYFPINTGNTNTVRFGPSPSTIQALQTFYGIIDDIGIWNRVLAPEEIQNLFTAPNLVGDGSAPLPQGIPYQAAARDGNGQPVADSPVNVRFTLHEGAADGATSYIESHSLTTNSIGLFNTVFGNGTPEQSAFYSINWAATTKFLQVEIDLGSGYVDMGTTQLLSVPYAFRSAQAATLKNAALPIYPDNAAALAGGLVAGEMYRTVAGDLKVVY